MGIHPIHAGQAKNEHVRITNSSALIIFAKYLVFEFEYQSVGN